MKTFLSASALALLLAGCETPPNDRYGNGPYGPGGYPEPYPPTAPYPPQSYPPQPYPPAPYPPYPPQAPMPGQTAPMLTGTNWTVVAINGRPTPQRDFYMNFMPDRIGAKFGCNSIGAGYRQSDGWLTAGALMATRMACPDSGFEAQATAVMMQPMIVSGGGDRLTLSNRSGSIDLVRAR